MKQYYIYALVDPRCPEIIRYVGQTYNPQKRLKQHIDYSKKNKTRRDKWIQSLIKNDIAPKMILLEITDENNSNEREIYWINNYLSDKLTNGTSGGKRCNFTEEVKQRISAATKGKKHKPMSEEGKRNIGNAIRGKKTSEETKEKLRKIKTGTKMPAEAIEKIRLARLGKSPSEEARQKSSKTQTGVPKGPYRNENERRRKISEAKTGKKIGPLKESTKKKMSEARGKLSVNDVEQIVKMIDNGISVTEISKIYQVHYSTISKIKHRQTWKYSI